MTGGKRLAHIVAGWVLLTATRVTLSAARSAPAQGEEVGLFLPLEGERVRLARFADPQPPSPAATRPAS
jgi:hypothetical protein